MFSRDTSGASRYDDIMVGCSTWNVNGKLVSENLDPFLSCSSTGRGGEVHGQSPRKNDIIAVGLQEIEQTAAATFLESTSAGAWWIAHLNEVMSKIGLSSPSRDHPEYTLVGHKQLVGLFLAVYVRSDWSQVAISSVDWSEIHCGVGNILGNKGALALRVVVKTPCGTLTSFVFVNAHMAPHEGLSAYENRNRDFVSIAEAVAAVTPSEITLLKAAWAALPSGEMCDARVASPINSGLDSVHVQPGNIERSGAQPTKEKESSSAWNFIRSGGAHAAWAMRAAGRAAMATHNMVVRSAPKPLNKSDIVFWMGDLNYRLDMNSEEARMSLSTGNFSVLKSRDQLANGISRGHTFPGFQEGDFSSFPPTYKFDPGTNTYDSSAKKRCPSWCDRILWRVMPHESPAKLEVTAISYTSLPSYISSDHKPVVGVYNVRRGLRCGDAESFAASPAIHAANPKPGDFPDLISFSMP